MTRRVFQEFDEFADAINGVAGRFVPTARTQGEWWVQVVPLGRLAIQQIQIGGASVFAGDGRDRAITLGIPITAPQRIRIDGDSLDERSYIAVREGQPFTFATRHATRWAGVTLPVEGILAPNLVEALSLRQSKPASSGTHTLCDRAHITRLRSIVARVCINDGASWMSGTACRMLEEEIVVLASRMLQMSHPAEIQRIGRPPYNRDRVIARVIELLEASHGRPLLLHDLCAAARVSERTLRTIFQEYFGVGPMRLIKLRQLHEIHRALLLAEPGHQRVRDILSAFGVSDLTIFARNYKALYGELPSSTLRRDPVSLERSMLPSLTWLRYAARRFECRAS